MKRFYKDLFIIFLIVFIGVILLIKNTFKQEVEKIIDIEKDYTCDFIVSQENLDLSGEELENKINEICYKEQQNTKLPKS